MLKSIIILPDGTEISSGVGQTNNIRSTALTECVNSGEELTLGSVCSNMLEATLQTPSGNLSLTAGVEITLCKEDADGRHQVGVFTLEKPTKPSANLLKLVGYDRVAKLDKDLTSWLKGLDGWPYSLLTFAGMVCRACGLTLVTKSIPNGDYQVPQLEIEATGRQLMGWIGEVCCRFCRATPSGDIELAWYQQAGVSIAPSGEHFCFQKGFSFEDYQVAPIEAVQLRLADSDDGALWPASADGANSYIIKNNPILLAAVTDTTRAALKVIEGVLQGVTYTPCKVSIPATLDIHAGDIVQITDVNGVTITTHVMTKVQKGQKDTMECTGSPRRDSSTAVNNKGPAYVSAAQAGAIASSKAAEETGKLDQLELLKRLTKEWVDDGIYLTGDGKLGINASAILTGILQAGIVRSKDEQTFYLDLDRGILRMQATEFAISGKSVDQIAKEQADSVLNDYTEAVTKDIASLQSQIDGNITTWFGNSVPTEENEPASNWTTNEIKNQHLGDLFYIVENEEQGGLVYRWALVNGVYSWRLVEDVEVAKALQQASEAKDTADGKRRVFVNQPTPPYDVGDLWAQGDNGDLMRCNTARSSGSYVASDWGLASKYIDEEKAGSIAQGKVDAQTHTEIFNKLTDGGKIQGIYVQDGNWYINAAIAKVFNLSATNVIAGKLSSVDGKSYFDLDNGKLLANNIEATGGTIGGCSIVDGVLKITQANIVGTITAGKVDADEGYIGGWTIDTNGLFRGTSGTDDFLGLYSQHPDTVATIGGVSSANWRIVAGTSFGVTRDGHLAASNATISGKVTAESGKIGPWSVENVTVYEGTTEVYSGVALTAYENGTQVALTPEYLYVTALDSYGNYTEFAAKWTKLAALVV